MCFEGVLRGVLFDTMILFTSNKSLQRAENVRAVFEACRMDKAFLRSTPGVHNPDFASPKYALRVTDEFAGSSPGKMIMIGHAISGGKYYGLDQPHPYHSMRGASLLTWVITSSPDMIPIVAHQSGVSESKVLALGVPRTDQYFSKRKGDGKTLTADKRVYLYAPTYRGGTDGGYAQISWKLIDRMLTDDEVLIVKPHMVTKTILRRPYRHIIEVSADVPSAPYLIDCDVLVTDYSSILFDAHILEKPVVLFEKNVGYIQSRGMYLEYPYGYASRYCRTETELVEMCRAAKEPQEADRRCRQLTASACDGHATERVIKLIEETI